MTVEEMIKAQAEHRGEITPEAKALLLGNSFESTLTRMFGSPFKW